MTIDLIPFILALIGLAIGALGIWVMRRKLLGPRLVLRRSEDEKEALVEGSAREQTSKKTK